MKKAIITGITGQDGSYLAELLLQKGYEVHGIVRRSSNNQYSRIHHLTESNNLNTHVGDLIDTSSLMRIVSQVKPDEVYNLAAQSHVKESFDIPEYTSQVTGTSVLSLLEVIKQTVPMAKFYQASSSEMFGKVQATPQNESTPFYPRSPYGVAKVFAYWATVNYREGYNLFAVNGILFNHESPRRGHTFVTKKITQALCAIAKGGSTPLQLGNLEAKRDWGYAKDFVEAMWLMLQAEKPEDYVIATGETHSVREFVEEACKILGIEITWEGKGLEEKGINKKTGRTIVEVSKKFFRPAEVDVLIGDYSKARKNLGWKPHTTFSNLVKLMIEEDLKVT